jgi:hypothetical protein
MEEFRNKRFENVGAAQFTLNLVELRGHGSSHAIPAFEDALRSNPNIRGIILDTLVTPEAQHSMARAGELGLTLIDLSIPPHSQILSRRSGISMIELLQIAFAPLVLKQDRAILTTMHHTAERFRLDPAVFHALIAHLNLTLSADRVAFEQHCGVIARTLIETALDLNWHKLKLLALEGEYLALVAFPAGAIFEAQFSPKLEFSPFEVEMVGVELAEFRRQGPLAWTQRSREDSLLFLDGEEDLFVPTIVAEAISNQTLSSARVERLEEEARVLMSEGRFLIAAKRAQALVAGGITRNHDLLGAALRAEYERLRQLDRFSFAGVISDILVDYGFEAHHDLMAASLKSYWSAFATLNRSGRGVA